ncbi:hypothetical protein [Massilia sp. SYSU DXS3249]
MKTQLLEDIGQSAAVSLTPPRTAGHRKAEKAVRDLASAGDAKRRPALGVWSQKPTWEPPGSVTRQADQQPTPLELHKVFEEIAALEAQYVPPGPQPEPQPQPQPQSQPATAPAEPRQALPLAPSGLVHQPALGPAEPTLSPNPAQGASATQDPLFDLSPPAPPSQPPQAADPFTPAGSRPARSGKRYLLWGGCLLAGALLIQGGRWLYQERGDAGAPALVRGAAMEQQSVLLKQPTAAPDGDLPAQPIVSASRPASNVPPLVMLEADPPTAAPVEQPPPPVAGQAGQEAASPLPKPSSRATRKEPAPAARQAGKTGESAPVRRPASAPASSTENPSSRDSGMAATLKACRAYGYDAAQCVKRACSITRYGFACRGR